MRFLAEASPSAARALEVAALSPANAFATAAFVRARESMGYLSWLFGFEDDKHLQRACFGFMRRGRVNCTLEIPSLPALADGTTFCEGVLRLCREQHVTLLELSSYSSESVAIPALPREASRHARVEWVIDLASGTWRQRLSTNHRRAIARARGLGVTIRQGADPAARAAHVIVMQDSFARRSDRGEDIAGGPLDSENIRTLSESGAGDFFQAILEDRVLSSVLVLHAERGAYYQSAGTSAEGMKIGASAFLIHSIADKLTQLGRSQFNLGGAGSENPGLQRFKAGFGSTAIPLAAVTVRPLAMWQNPLAVIVRGGRRIFGRAL